MQAQLGEGVKGRLPLYYWLGLEAVVSGGSVWGEEEEEEGTLLKPFGKVVFERRGKLKWALEKQG